MGLRSAYRASFGERRALSFALVLLVVVFGIGFSTNFWLPLRLGYLLLFGLLLAWTWTHLSGRGLRVRLGRDAERIQAGQTIVERIEITNEIRIPKLWLEVEEISDLPGHESKHIVSLGGSMRRNWRVETVCRRRGLFSLGPIIVRSGDPFDFFRVERSFGKARQLLVYPRPLELPRYAVPPANLPGEGRFRRRTHYVTPNASGLRDYEPGDSVNRIHWPSSLRTGTGRLLVKTFELDPASQMWIVLDLNRTDHAGEDEESTIEYGVSAAASVARLFLAQNRSVGLMTFGTGLDLVQPDRGAQQLGRMLETLAMSEAVGDVPLSTLLFQQARRWGRHTTLIVITAASDDRWVAALRSLTQRGVKAAVIQLDHESFGGRAGAQETEGALRASGVQVNVVRQGDSLPAVLVAGGGGRGVGHGGLGAFVGLPRAGDRDTEDDDAGGGRVPLDDLPPTNGAGDGHHALQPEAVPAGADPRGSA